MSLKGIYSDKNDDKWIECVTQHIRIISTIFACFTLQLFEMICAKDLMIQKFVNKNLRSRFVSFQHTLFSFIHLLLCNIDRLCTASPQSRFTTCVGVEWTRTHRNSNNFRTIRVWISRSCAHVVPMRCGIPNIFISVYTHIAHYGRTSVSQNFLSTVSQPFITPLTIYNK